MHLIVQVPFCVLEKSELTAKDMIDIMRHVHKYVPQTKGVIAEFSLKVIRWQSKVNKLSCS